MTSTISFLLISFVLHSSECARKAMEGFIVGGHFASISAYPHAAFLSVYCGKEWICGSAILNQNILLTAAHCLHGCDLKKKGHNIKVSVGSANLNKVIIKREIKRMYIHRKYNETTVANDIALGLVSRRIPLGSAAKRVIIMRKFPRDTGGYVAGWGVTDEVKKVTAIKLKLVHQKLRSIHTCALLGHLEPGMFCAGSTTDDDDHPAQGDSGSALITSSFTAIGLVSFRITDYPALLAYTNVSYYYPWVQKHAKTLFCG